MCGTCQLFSAGMCIIFISDIEPGDNNGGFVKQITFKPKIIKFQ